MAEAQSLDAVLGEPVLDIGVAEGPEQLVFGQIVGVANSPSGGIVVLDSQHRRLSAFAPDGTFLGQAGGAGEGPGEFVAPVAVEMVGEEALVLDALQARIQRFRLDDEGLYFVESMRLPMAARTFCVLDNLLAAFGYVDGEMVHLLTPEGERVRSFGHPFHDDPLVARFAGNGHLLCVGGAAPAVVVVPLNFPTVYVYDLDGTLRWSGDLPGFDGGTIGRSPSGTGVAFGPAEDGGPGDLAVSVVALDDMLLVQWGQAFEGMGALEDITSVRSAAYDLRDGSRLELPGDLPRLDVVQGGRAFSHANDPFPRIRVFDLDRD